MKNKKIIIIIAGVIIIATVGLLGAFALSTHASTGKITESINVKPVSSTILATGAVESQAEATLRFQTGGKLIYLPFKEGDTVSAGQTIAQLDTYALQRQLTQALNTYRSTRDTFDQTQENAQDGVLQGQQKAQNIGGITGQTQVNIINDIISRVVDQNQANLDNSVINVELANYAMQLATITSPMDGIITHEDVTTPNINITPTTSFSVADPNQIVFRANVSETDINFIDIGSNAKVTLAGSSTVYEGTVVKIYPDKITLPTGENVYQVDIQSDGVKTNGKFSQEGTALIQNKFNQTVILVPAWTVLGNQYIWVKENNTAIMKKVTTGQIVGNMIEVTGGLSTKDTVITSPQSVIAKNYLLF